MRKSYFHFFVEMKNELYSRGVKKRKRNQLNVCFCMDGTKKLSKKNYLLRTTLPGRINNYTVSVAIIYY